ncbi:MAG: hypothetical protein JSS55_15425 [Proteobacteria bacterium]|nr:hypothetical protein [Pseudomonadota bacterium]
MRHLLFAAFVALLPAVSSARTVPDQALPKPVRKLAEAIDAADAKDCGKAVKLAERLAEAKGGLNELGQSLALDTLARCAFMTGDKAQAAVLIRRATAFDAASDDIWHRRLQIDLLAQDWDAAVGSVEAMVTDGRGGALNRISEEAISHLDNELRRAKRKDLQKRLLQVLASDGYSPTDLFADTDLYRRRLAIQMAEEGDTARAKALVEGLTDPWSVARASLDLRLRRFLPADPDIRALLERRLEGRLRIMRANPDRLEPLIYVASDLRKLGRVEQALKVLQTAAPQIAEADAYVDAAKHGSWWWDELSRTYVALGRFDEAADALRKGGELSENGGSNVSQTINLAHLQVRAGRSGDALKTLAAFMTTPHNISPYGEVALRSARACAFADTGNRAEALKDVAYIRDHQLDAPGSLDGVALCVGDLDGAAAALIKRLEDPDERVDALLDLSDYDDPPVKLPDNIFNRDNKKLIERPDVKAAIASAGGTRRFRIQG